MWNLGRAKRIGGWVLALSASAFVLAQGAAFELRRIKRELGPPPLELAEGLSTTVVDREGRLLRAFTTRDGRWRLPVEPSEVDEKYLAMLMAFEDRRFYSHPGFDARAILRSVLQLIKDGRIVSGGSTLTMQVARLLDGKHERTGAGKIRQIVRAMQLEERLSKKEILGLYLRLAPFGGNIEGVRAASLAYFGKEPRRLSTGEAALLVALPQSPEVRRPDRNPRAAERGRNIVLSRAVAVGLITAAEAERARGERVPEARLEFPKLAPHLSESEAAKKPLEKIHRLTLDREIQASLEELVSEHIKTLGSRLSAAVIAADHTTGEILAYVGSAGYLDTTRFGAIDMVETLRSPGSTLKPLIYGLGFEQGIIHPETLIEDRPTRFGSYRPENFDDDFQGTVTVREALGQSLNIPAVKVLNAVGPGRMAGRLRRARIGFYLPAGTEPSLPMALGGLGMSLKDLADLYAGLARAGDPITLTWDPIAVKRALGSRQESKPRRLLSPVAAWYVTDILKDAPPPPNAAKGRIAYKTGTSYGYRDAWAAGYDGRYTIAVWVGRPDGVPTPGMIGRTAAAPILFDAFARLAGKRVAFPGAPSGVLKLSGSELPPPLKRFRESDDENTAAGPYLEPSVLIAFPPDRAELELDEVRGEGLVIKAEGGALPLTWMVDGEPISSDPHRRELAWQPTGEGFVRLSVVDAKGRVDRVTVRLKQR
jgi:penicillin-binding protein 1C